MPHLTMSDDDNLKASRCWRRNALSLHGGMFYILPEKHPTPSIGTKSDARISDKGNDL